LLFFSFFLVLDLLTAREHLYLYGRIRGLPIDRLLPSIEKLIQQLGLTPFADTISETYSGGTKRKLR
jgi:ABC-type multidrug transport system ATPase subunit